MRVLCAATALSMATSGMADEALAATKHRYLIERTFPAGALAGVDAAAKQKVNANNQSLGVGWEKSYANADQTKTYCVYTGPSEQAVRDAAKLNGLPVDTVTEIPWTTEGPGGAAQNIGKGKHRYLVKRSAATVANADGDAKYGVTLLTSYGTADDSGSYWVYESPDMAAVERAARAAGAPIESIAEIPETLYPN